MVHEDPSSTVTTSSSAAGAAAAAATAWLRDLSSDERGLCLIHLLLRCATLAAAGDLGLANACLEPISVLASPSGDAVQRLATHFAAALARRALRPWPGLCAALSEPSPTPADAVLARRLFSGLCPFLQVAAFASTQAVLEALQGEKVVHVLDLGGAAASGSASHWVAFLQALRALPEGPPHLRFTAVGEHPEALRLAGMHLSEEAERLDIPFQFNPVLARVEELDLGSLRVKSGEALAVTATLQLHCLLATDDDGSRIKRAPASIAPRTVPLSQLEMPGEVKAERGSVTGYRSSPDSASSPATTSAKMETFLASLRELSPKIVVVAEQESNHNAQAPHKRFAEALNYYAALFDCMESTAPRASAERMKVERMLFGEEINNIIACEGVERRERHEKLERWVQRLEMAGFGRAALSSYGLVQARRLLESFGVEGYKVKEENGCFFVCWQERPLFSVSAWKCRKYQ